MAELARSNPTGHRLLYVLRLWADAIEQRSPGSRFARVLPMLVPHMAGDIGQIPEQALRAGLVQIQEAIGAILDPPPAADAVRPAHVAGADAETG